MSQIINYKSIDGTKLVGILEAKAKSNKSCMIMCHGLKTDKDEYGDFKKISKQLVENYDIFRFDFRAHGESQGDELEMTLQGLKQDLEATIRLIRCEGYKDVCILGASFGASILSLIDYGKFPEVKRLIIWSGSIDANKGNPKGSLGKENYQKAMEEGYIEIKSKTTGKAMRLSRTFMEETRSLEPEEKIKTIDIPILFIHGTEDETTPYKVNQQISWNCKKTCFVAIKGGKHGLHEPKSIAIGSKYIESFLKLELLDRIVEEEDLSRC